MDTQKTIRVARCDRCGLCFPDDYFEEWGRKYGRGLGPDPKCEGLASNYRRPSTPKGVVRQAASEIMHPLFNCGGTMTLVDVSVEEEADNRPILAIEDRGMKRRAAIIKARQMVKSPEMRAAVAAFK